MTADEREKPTISVDGQTAGQVAGQFGVPDSEVRVVSANGGNNGVVESEEPLTSRVSEGDELSVTVIEEGWGDKNGISGIVYLRRKI